MEKKTRRARVMINREFQLGLMGRFALINASVMVLFGFFAYLFFDSEVNANLHSAHVTYSNMKDMLFPVTLTLSVINVLVSSSVIALVVLRASHRIAGPLYRFKMELEGMARGNLASKVTIREYDQLYGCVPAMRELATAIAGDLGRIREGVIRADRALEKRKTAEARKALEDLASVVSKYETGD